MKSLPLWLLAKIDPFAYALMGQKADLLHRTKELLRQQIIRLKASPHNGDYHWPEHARAPARSGAPEQ